LLEQKETKIQGERPTPILFSQKPAQYHRKNYLPICRLKTYYVLPCSLSPKAAALLPTYAIVYKIPSIFSIYLLIFSLKKASEIVYLYPHNIKIIYIV